jgi:putative phage-type endonuclease
MKLNLIQGSDDWLIWRDGGIGGSDVSVLTGSNPWTKLRDLWNQKTGRVERPDLSDNFAVQRGLRLEPVARSMYEQRTGEIVPEAVYVSDANPRFKASTDGINMDETGLIEIKIPGQKVHEGCGRGEVPAHYMEQMQWYLMITGAQWADFVTLYYYEDMPDMNIHRVLPDLELQATMAALADDFLACMDNDLPPGYSDTDVEDLSGDEIWMDMESELQFIDSELAKLNDQRNLIRDKMKVKAEFHSVRGCNYQMTRATRKGSLDYAKWAKAEKLTCPESYRKKGSVTHTIRAVKNDTNLEEAGT